VENNPELTKKLAILADAAKYDASCASSGSKRKNNGGLGNTEGMGICHSYTPDGRCISLLKILLTNHCVFDCTYCVNRASSDVPRAKFTIEEVVSLTIEFYRRNYIEGLFLSSGVLRTPDETFQQMIEVARRLRCDFNFGGYIHLKAVAGTSPELLLQAGKWADRLSANLEFPNQKDLDTFAPAKNQNQIQSVMDRVAESISENRSDKKRGLKNVEPFAPGGQSTQLIVGATASSDGDILTRADSLYKTQRLRRVYYTAFSPFPNADPRLPAVAAPLIREHRLYQADWLIRFYGFAVNEITPTDVPNLSLSLDPKLAWAMRNPHFFPVDINVAPKESLLRVPGLGIRNVERILKIRRFHKITMANLITLRVPLKRTRYFILTADNHSGPRDLEASKTSLFTQPAEQLSLFDAPATARTGEF
jgi:putative DNA modification/repair radical SAM protein